MKKTITLENGQELVLDNNLGWLMEYQNQIGEDILPTLMPIILSISDLIGGLAEAGVDLNKMTVNNFAEILHSEAAMDAGVKLATFKTTDVINIIWAMAKAADDNIDEPRKWIRQFDEGFPMDVILPEAAKLVVKGVLSSKNQTRLQENIKKLQPKSRKKKSK